MGPRRNGDTASPCGSMDEHCVAWVSTYMGECLCNTREVVSFAVGLMSVVCWGVAEVPQIVTNFREGSTEGLSLVFLMTWVVGDVFNLVGCYLEPSTLPTQFYVALLYTITTIVLVAQVIYYQHYLKWWKHRTVTAPTSMQDKLVKPTPRDEAAPATPPVKPGTQPIAYTPRPPFSAPGRQRYYMSARSLASSHTPTAGSFLSGGSRGSGGGSTNIFLDADSNDTSHPIPIPATSISTSRSAPAPAKTGFSPSILRAVASVAMCVGGLNIGQAVMIKHRGRARVQTPRVFSGRKLFQSTVLQTEYLNRTLQEVSEETIGFWLGWMMAAIYMGGRLPQIWLNMKRGSVEGLNPLMFTFALLGNVTYVGSILIGSMEWETLKSNMPWLVDAGVCVVLDFLILCQFMYYYTRKGRDGKYDSAGDYKILE